MAILMKIICIDDVTFPDSGYSSVIYSKYWQRLGHEVYILTSELDKVPDELTNFFGKDNITHRDEIYRKKYGVRIIRIPIVAYYSGRSIYKASYLHRVIKKIDPDVVYVNGNDSLIGIQLTLMYPFLNYGLVLDSHMLEMASINKFSKMFHSIYKSTIAPYIRLKKISVIRAQDDSYIEKELGIPLDSSPFISFGSDRMLFHPDNGVYKSWRKKHRIAMDARVVLYAGKMDEGKGGSLLADALYEKFETDKQLVFVVIGNTVGEKKGYIEKRFVDSSNIILRYPTQKYEDLAPFYQAADVALYPKQCSLSFYDVQSCGLPVVFEDNNINIDRASHHNAITFESGNIQDFRNKILWFANMDAQELQSYKDSAVKYIKSDYDYEDKAKEFLVYLKRAARRKGRI